MSGNRYLVPVRATGVASATVSPHYFAATTVKEKGDGHLFSVAGIVFGDYALQLHFAQLPPTVKTVGYEVQLRVGTPEICHAVFRQSLCPAAALLAAPTKRWNLALHTYGRTRMANGSDATTCQKTLQAAGLSPICSTVHCQDVWEGQAYHKLCFSTKSILLSCAMRVLLQQQN